MLFAVAQHYVVNLFTFSVFIVPSFPQFIPASGCSPWKKSLYNKSTLKPDEPLFIQKLTIKEE